MLEIIYIDAFGIRRKSLAHYSYRYGPIGEWVLGEIRLKDMMGTILSRRIRQEASGDVADGNSGQVGRREQIAVLRYIYGRRVCNACRQRS